jgi:hypothetical protein
MKFVAEREYLRSQYPQTEGQDKAEYEEFLANKALDNTFNLYNLFKDPENNYAKRYTELLNKYPRLANRFEVLKKISYDDLKVKTRIGTNVVEYANLKLNDRDVNNSKANLYTTNIKNLSDVVSLRKLGYSEASAIEISDFFKKLPMYAYLQSGLNKTPYSLTSIVEYTDFANILKQESEDFIKVLESDKAPIVLEDFNTMFLNENSMKRGNKRGRLKDFITDIDFRNINAANKKEVSTTPQLTEEEKFDLGAYIVNLQTLNNGDLELTVNNWLTALKDNSDNLSKKSFNDMLNQVLTNKLIKSDASGVIEHVRDLGNAWFNSTTEEEQDYLEETSVENMMTFDDQNADVNYYRDMVKQHPDVIFITNPAVTDIQTKFAKPETNQAKFAKLAGEMSITIPTDLRPGDNMKTFPVDKYDDYKKMVERKIADIKAIMNSQPVAFSKAGYGNSYSMPQELFVYLSKRLYEEFGYVNPGSAIDNQLSNQDIDDAEILQSLGFESDPFKC